MAKKIYKEKQHFLNIRQRWLIGSAAMLTLYILIRLSLIRDLHLDFTDLLTGLLAAAVLTLSIWFLLRLRLKSAVSERGIEYKMRPFHQKKRIIPWDHIKRINIMRMPRNYSWQKRYNSYMLQRKYTFSGRNGISIETVDGEAIFLGSQQVNELQHALERARQKFNLSPTG